VTVRLRLLLVAILLLAAVAAMFLSVRTSSPAKPAGSGSVSPTASASPMVRPLAPADRAALISDLPVFVEARMLAVAADGASFAVAGRTAMVVELDLASSRFRESWSLPAEPDALFVDGDRYLAVVGKLIYALRDGDQEIVGEVPDVSNTITQMPEGCELLSSAEPILCNAGRILWVGDNSLKERRKGRNTFSEMLVLWTDLSGKLLETISGEEAESYRDLRAIVGGQWALARDGKDHWLVTHGRRVPMPQGGVPVSMGEKGFALAFDGYRFEYDAATGELARKEGSLPVPLAASSRRDAGFFLTAAGYVINGLGAIIPPEGKPDPRTQFTLVSRDAQCLYLVDRDAPAFVKACVATDSLERIPCDGVPLYFDADIKVTFRGGKVFVNEREVPGLPKETLPRLVTRKGDLLYIEQSEMTLAVLGSLRSLDRRGSFLVGAFDEAIILGLVSTGEQNPDTSTILFVETREPFRTASIPLYDHLGSFQQIGAALYECCCEQHTACLDELYEVLPDFSAGVVRFRQLPEDATVPLPAGYSVNLWDWIPTVTDGRGVEYVLPPAVREGSFLFGGWGRNFDVPAFAEFGGALFLQCGVNFIRLEEAQE